LCLADAATTPGQTAATAAATAATASPTDAATTASAASAATATATATAPSDLYAVLSRCRVFLVEDIERGEADVGDFFFAERDCMTR
jgi:hypothetical protein